VLALVSTAVWSRYMRSSMLEVINQDYIRTARAKGLPERIPSCCATPCATRCCR
jgi:peptide/nickel transport system permease protein